MELECGPIRSVILEPSKSLVPVGTGAIASCEIHGQFKRTERPVPRLHWTHPAEE